jgi:hypothetical protein
MPTGTGPLTSGSGRAAAPMLADALGAAPAEPRLSQAHPLVPKAKTADAMSQPRIKEDLVVGAVEAIDRPA